MDILWILLIVWGVVAALYAFRLCQKYFAFFEGDLRNGTIITQALGAGLIWPLTLLLNGSLGVWTELKPVNVVVNQPAPQFDPTQPLPGLDAIAAEAARENLSPPRAPWQQ